MHGAAHAKIACMAHTEKSAPAPKRTTGLSPKEQKLQALRDKLAAQKTGGAKPEAAASNSGGFQAKSNVARKTSFQRKAT